ncbi:type II secretion system protein [Sulfurovum lithotrophicum]|uniref:type II secretion system protein n=1 Tax=Sulfurovum lithotrophicum TaxID=206403 RepID=UPI00146FCF2E|nr:type II secretion system protein [Sulfurovum lithotrophicum]
MKNTNAFTLLEVTIVIVILGIVASIGSEIIANVYKNYLLQRATYSASLKTELAAQQIANLLSHRIPHTTIAKNPDNLSDFLLVTDPTNNSDYTHTQLEWIGADNDGFSASIRPPWNGFADVDASDQTKVITPGSKLSLTDSIISNLSNSQVSLSGPQYPAIFFRDMRYTDDGSTPKLYDILTCMGVTSNDNTCISAVSRTGEEQLDFQTPGSGVANKVISEHYKLAWSAYSICPKNRGNRHYDLVLFYNYQPWEGERLNGTDCSSTVGEHATVITNVTVFKFAESGNTFRFKLCAQENIGGDYNITICKEKAIIL